MCNCCTCSTTILIHCTHAKIFKYVQLNSETCQMYKFLLTSIVHTTHFRPLLCTHYTAVFKHRYTNLKLCTMFVQTVNYSIHYTRILGLGKHIAKIFKQVQFWNLLHVHLLYNQYDPLSQKVAFCTVYSSVLHCSVYVRLL